MSRIGTDPFGRVLIVLEELQGKENQENFKLSDASGASCHASDERSTIFCYLFDKLKFTGRSWRTWAPPGLIFMADDLLQIELLPKAQSRLAEHLLKEG